MHELIKVTITMARKSRVRSMFLANFFPYGNSFSWMGPSLLLAAWALSVEVMTRSKCSPRNFSSSSVERNRNSVQESTPSTQPSNRPSAGFVSGPKLHYECSSHNGVRIGERR